MTTDHLTVEKLGECVGTELGTSSWIDVRQERITAFA
jgi:hypothetical protein